MVCHRRRHELKPDCERQLLMSATTSPSASQRTPSCRGRGRRNRRPRSLHDLTPATPRASAAPGASLLKTAAFLSVLLVCHFAAATPSSTWCSTGLAVAPPFGVRGGASGVQGGGPTGPQTPAYARNPPRDRVLYDELEVHWGATARDIKKAYYRLAVQHHPDKRPGDLQSEDRFKRASEAYQILQDDSVREKYHRQGLSALEDDSWGGGGREDGAGVGTGSGGSRGRGSRVDPMEVFRTFLGGGMFEHLIGPLSPRMVPVKDPDYHHRKSKALAEELERRLEVDVRGNSFWFDRAAWAEALQLREQSMGRQILQTVGYVYKNYARRSLGKLAPNVLQPEAIRGRMGFYSDQAHRVNNLLSAVSSTTRLYVHLQTRKPEQPSPVPGSAQRYSAEEETVTRVMEALWSVHRVDVEHTVQRACKMVLRDPRVPPSGRRKRAEALMRLGRIFTSAAKGKNPDPGTHPFVEYASSDPFAASVAATSASASSPSPPPYASYDSGYGYGYGYGYGGGVDVSGSGYREAGGGGVAGSNDGGGGGGSYGGGSSARATSFGEDGDGESSKRNGHGSGEVALGVDGGLGGGAAWATADGGRVSSPWMAASTPTGEGGGDGEAARAGGDSEHRPPSPVFFGVDGERGGEQQSLGLGVGAGGGNGDGDGGGVGRGAGKEAGPGLNNGVLPFNGGIGSGGDEGNSARGAGFVKEDENLWCSTAGGNSEGVLGDGWVQPQSGSFPARDRRSGTAERTSDASRVDGTSGGKSSDEGRPVIADGGEDSSVESEVGAVQGEGGTPHRIPTSPIVLPSPQEETPEADDDWRENVG